MKNLIAYFIVLNILTFSNISFADYPNLSITIYNHNPVTWPNLQSIPLTDVGLSVNNAYYIYTYQQTNLLPPPIIIKPYHLEGSYGAASFVVKSPDNQHWCRVFTRFHGGDYRSYVSSVKSFGSNCQLNISPTNQYQLTLIMS